MFRCEEEVGGGRGWHGGVGGGKEAGGGGGGEVWVETGLGGWRLGNWVELGLGLLVLLLVIRELRNVCTNV